MGAIVFLPPQKERCHYGIVSVNRALIFQCTSYAISFTLCDYYIFYCYLFYFVALAKSRPRISSVMSKIGHFMSDSSKT